MIFFFFLIIAVLFFKKNITVLIYFSWLCDLLLHERFSFILKLLNVLAVGDDLFDSALVA